MKTGGEDVEGDLILPTRDGLVKGFIAWGQIEGPDDGCVHEGSRTVAGARRVEHRRIGRRTGLKTDTCPSGVRIWWGDDRGERGDGSGELITDGSPGCDHHRGTGGALAGLASTALPNSLGSRSGAAHARRAIDAT